MEDVQDSTLRDALSERYLAYALSTIMSRSLPDVRDTDQFVFKFRKPA